MEKYDLFYIFKQVGCAEVGPLLIISIHLMETEISAIQTL